MPYRLTLMTAYVTDIAKRMSQAWSSAGDAIKKAQVQQKQQHDVRSCSAMLVEGKRVLVYMPTGTGPAWLTNWQGYTMVHTVQMGSRERRRSQTSRPHATTLVWL